MISALNTAVSGLKAAAARVTDAATTIVRAGTATSATPAAPPLSGAPLNAGPIPQDDLLTGLLDLKQAELAYKANAKLIASLGRTERETLNILG